MDGLPTHQMVNEDFMNDKTTQMSHHIKIIRRNFVEILFRNAQSPNPPQAHGYVAVLNKKAPHPRNPRSSPPFNTADPHLSPLVKLIHLSHTTVRCHPIHASFIRISRHIHRKRSDTQGKKSKRTRDKISGKSVPKRP